MLFNKIHENQQKFVDTMLYIKIDRKLLDNDVEYYETDKFI